LRIIRSLVVVAAVAATTTTLVVAPAMADPLSSKLKPVRPAPYDIVGVGSGTDEYLFDQLSVDYNAAVAARKKHSPSNPYIYSWDATPPNNPLDETQQIVVKAGCKKEPRPNGSNAGISALSSYGSVKYAGKTYPCVNFARSSRGRKSSDPDLAKGGVAFVALARDAVTYATAKISNVPADLSLAELQEIFSCSIPAAHGFAEGTWGALLGASAQEPNAKPDPIVPQPGAGTLTFWMETALGFDDDSQPQCGSAATLPATSQPEENEGISPLFLTTIDGKKVPNPNVIFPYSIGSWVAQAYHSKACGDRAKKGQNKFGCDENGVLYLNSIGGTAPTVTVKGVVSINPAFDSKFQRLLYDVVPYYTAKSQISGLLSRFFGRKGWFCLKSHDQVIKDYGYLPTPLCGTVS
jgi:ABC-type phosphate transport system substrate-binding protein